MRILDINTNPAGRNCPPQLDIHRGRIDGQVSRGAGTTSKTRPMNQLLCTLLVILAITASGLPAAAADDNAPNGKIVSPETIKGVINVDAEGLIEKVVEIPELVIIDSRITADRKAGYIEGSVSLPDTDTNCATLAATIPATSTPVLFYCNGIHCGRSARAAQIAVDCGYTEIYWYRNGMVEWQEQQYPLVQ